MSRRFVPLIAPSAIVALALLGAGCAGTADEQAVASSTDALSGGKSYFHLERNSDGSYVASRANGGSFTCPDGSVAARCTFAAIELPADCTWECTDGLLSFRGVVFVRGAFVSTWDATLHHGVTTLKIAAGFDAIQTGAPRPPRELPYYRVLQNGQKCVQGVCAPRYAVTALGSGATQNAFDVDFGSARDVNYALDPMRGYTQIARPEGLLASGQIVDGVFVADWIFRQWTPVVCDVLGAAHAYFFREPDEDQVNLDFASEAEAERYQDPDGRHVSWLAPRRATPGRGRVCGRHQRSVVAALRRRRQELRRDAHRRALGPRRREARRRSTVSAGMSESAIPQRSKRPQTQELVRALLAAAIAEREAVLARQMPEPIGESADAPRLGGGRDNRAER